MERDRRSSYEPIAPRWYTTKQVALMLGYSLTKTKHLVLTGQLRSVKDGDNRVHIVPYLGKKRLDRIQVKDVREWLNKLGRICQCCARGKDTSRPAGKRRCCAIGNCCHAVLSIECRKTARSILRAALTCAVEEEVISRNPAAIIRLSNRNDRARKRHSRTVDEARRFLESARRDDDVLYAAYVLVLVLGLRKGELLGLTWESVNLDSAELHVSQQVQRVGGQLVRRQTKTESSEAPLPLPDSA